VKPKLTLDEMQKSEISGKDTFLDKDAFDPVAALDAEICKAEAEENDVDKSSSKQSEKDS
jgi:hypothetical protein